MVLNSLNKGSNFKSESIDLHFELKHFLEAELSFDARPQEEQDEFKYADDSPKSKKNRRRILENNKDFNNPNKRDEEYKELRRIIQEGLDMENKLKSHSKLEHESKLDSSDYTPNHNARVNKFSKGKRKGKYGIREQPKTSTISFTLNMMVDEDRVKRIQSAHAMQRSKERDESVTNSISNGNLNRKKSSGIIYDEWLFK